MQLVADRFVVRDDGGAIDLATGHSVVLTIAAAGGCADQTRWAVRCDALHALHHPAIAPLVDYGALGESQRFEAWACGRTWSGARAQAERVVRAASSFLRACGLTAGGCSSPGVHHETGRPLLLPDDETGYPCDPVREDVHGGEAIERFGIAHVERRAESAIAELFDGAAAPRPQVVALWGPEGAGKTSVIFELARVARLKGLVPVSVRLLGSPWADLIGGRTLFLIDDGASTGWKSLLDASIRSPRPHVLVFAGVEEVRAVQGLALERLSADALTAAIRPIRRTSSTEEQVRRAVQQADGLPGRLTGLLWRSRGAGKNGGPAQAGHYVGAPCGSADGPFRAGRHVGSSHGAWHAAERPAVYGGEDIAEIETVAPPDAPRWPVPGELAALRRQMDAAMRHLETGRHAPGDRGLRQAIGSLARRDDWANAGRGALALAASLLKRGRPRDAQSTLDEARGHWARAGEDAPLVDVATLAGVAWTDLARLDEAEGVLASAIGAARSNADAARAAPATLALARCLFWRGRYADADQALTPFMNAALSDRTAVRFAVMASRVAVGLRDYGRAVSSAADAVGRARAIGDAGLSAEAACAAAFAHLAVGDVDAVERDAAACVAAARTARDPLRAIRARLILAEQARRSNRRPMAAALLHRLKNVAPRSLPPIVRARCDLLDDLLSAPTSAPAIAARHLAATGLTALMLFLPAVRRDRSVRRHTRC